jgi:hypothetical protein
VRTRQGQSGARSCAWLGGSAVVGGGRSMRELASEQM